MTINPVNLLSRTVYKLVYKNSGEATYRKFTDSPTTYIYLSNRTETTNEQRARFYFNDYSNYLEFGCHKAKIKMKVSRTEGNSGKINIYISQGLMSDVVETLYEDLRGGEFIYEIEPTSTEKTYEFEVTGEEKVNNIIKYGMNCNAERTEEEDIIEFKITDVYVECEYYIIRFKKDLMVNGGSYPEGGTMDYYQYIDKPFLLVWEYNQTIISGTIETEIKIHTYATNDGTPASDWSIEDGTYKGNIGETILPSEAWKRLPCSGWIEVVIKNEIESYVSDPLYFDVPFHEVEVTSPAKDATIKFEVENILEWILQENEQYIAFPQISGYQVLISTNNGATYDLYAEITGDTRKYIFPENTLPLGIVYVHVVAMYDNNTIGQNLLYGEGRFIVGADPDTSTVICDGKPIPTVSWESVAQTSYQVKFGDYDSGTVYSSEKSHRVPYFFADGVYEVTVRTQISTGEWSEWSEPIYVQITNTAPGLGITATAERSGFRVKIVWTKNSGYTDYIVYRNGVPIHVTDGGISTEGGYMDNMANGLSLYMVRGITADGYYDQSETVTVDASWDTDILFALGTDEILPLKYTPSFPRSYNYASEMSVTYRYFAGRPKPIAITSGQVSRTLPLSYIDRGRTLARKLAGMIGRTVVFKDSGGDMIIGILNMVNAGMGRMTSTTTFQITEVDYNERVEYIPGE